MAIIVDKEAKRRDIALSCQNILHQHGIENLTIAQIAQTAGVGKGTIYEYFANKEDIVFEIITTIIHDNIQRLEELAQTSLSTREKLFRFGYSLFEGEMGKKHLKIFREFIAIALTHHTEEMLDFSEKTRTEFRLILNRIIADGIAQGELTERFRNIAESLIIFSTGLMIDSHLHGFSIEKELNTFLDLLFPSPTGDPQ